VTVGDYETPSDPDDGDRREPLPGGHRLPIALDTLRRVRGSEEIHNPGRADQARGELRARRLEACGRRTGCAGAVRWF
jgi:hypothetical protein